MIPAHPQLNTNDADFLNRYRTFNEDSIIEMLEFIGLREIKSNKVQAFVTWVTGAHRVYWGNTIKGIDLFNMIAEYTEITYEMLKKK